MKKDREEDSEQWTLGKSKSEKNKTATIKASKW